MNFTLPDEFTANRNLSSIAPKERRGKLAKSAKREILENQNRILISFYDHGEQKVNRWFYGLFIIDVTLGLCERSHMATNLNIDDRLLNLALKIGGRKTKKDTVNEALNEYIQRREQKKVIRLFGTVEEDGYDPKQYRRR